MKMAEYLDRLPYEKIEKLREVIGIGELAWKSRWRTISPEKKLEVGRVTFGREVKSVTMEFERDVSRGFDIPVIIAESV